MARGLLPQSLSSLSLSLSLHLTLSFSHNSSTRLLTILNPLDSTSVTFISPLHPLYNYFLSITPQQLTRL